jgi:flagellar biogenesis protein FliO
MDGLLSLIAQGLGTRANPVEAAGGPPSGDGGIGDLVRLGLALLVIVAALKWLAPPLLAKFQGRIQTPLDSSLRVEESASFGAGQLSVVTVRGRTLLLGCTPQAVSMLADLTDADRAERAQPETFFELLDRAEGLRPEEEQETPGMRMEEAMALISSAQERLRATPASRIDQLIDDPR